MDEIDDYKNDIREELDRKWNYLMTLGDLDDDDDDNNDRAKFILSCNEILHYASEVGDYDKISSLLNQFIPELNSDLEIDVDETVDSSEVTPLMIACREGYPDIVKILIENNANVNAVSISKTTPLIAVAQNSIMDKEKQLTIVEQLITAGEKEEAKAKANINYQDEYGKTALILAIESNSPKIVSILLLSGADINIKDQGGYNALATAELQEYSEIIKIIKDYIAIAIAKQNEKQTPVKIMGGTKKRRTIKKKNKKIQKKKSKKRKTI